VKEFIAIRDKIKKVFGNEGFVELNDYIASGNEVLESTRQELKRYLIESIENDYDVDVGKCKEILNDIAELKSAYSAENVPIAEANEPTKKRKKETVIIHDMDEAEETEDTQKNENRYFTIDDDLSNRRPTFVKFQGLAKNVYSWRHMVEEICRELYKIDKEKFLSFVRNKELNGTKSNYFAKSGKDMESPALIGESGRGIFVDTAKLVVNDFSFLKKVLKVYGFSGKDVNVMIDPNYRRKQRANRKQEE